MTRRYLPATLDVVAELQGGTLVDAGEALVAEDDSEDAEYAALVTAADASAALAAGLGDGRRRRVVIVAETRGQSDEIGIADVVAVHADPEDDADPDDDLGWYATQEIPALLA